MIDREKVINQIDVDIQKAERTGEMLVFVGRKTAKDALALLKEQEPVEPIYGLHGERRCGVCRNKFFVYKQLFCASCGRAAKWE